MGDEGTGRRRVAIVNPADQIRTETRVLAGGLAERGHRVTVVTPDGARGRFEHPRVEWRQFRAAYVPGVRYTIPHPRLLATLVAVFRRADVVVVTSCIYLPSLLAALVARLTGRPALLVVDALPGVNWSYGQPVVDAVGALYVHTAGRATMAAVDAVVGLGEYLRADLERFADPDRVVVVPNGVDTDRFSPGSTADQPTRWERGPPRDPVRLLYVGRLDPVKNVPDLLAAVRTLAVERGVDCELTLVGDGTERATYEREAAALDVADRVTFEGWRDDVAPYYRSHDLLVLPSVSEGQPTVLLEAQACGMPVVTTDVGGAGALVGAGCVVPPGRPDAIATAVGELLDRDRAALAAAARRHVVAEFSRRTTVDRYCDLFDRLLAPTGAGGSTTTGESTPTDGPTTTDKSTPVDERRPEER